VPVLFLDSSALVRRYDTTEPGSERVTELCTPISENALLIAVLASVEIASALNRKVREGRLAPVERDLLWEQFRVHLRDEYEPVVLEAEILQEAERLTFQYPLRAYDAIQLASAHNAFTTLAGRADSLTFCTSDRAQARAAAAEGLQVELIA
jgi:predicted nucleic acid-binding protein